jgi:nucleoside-diphosphate-sugar epimerase
MLVWGGTGLLGQGFLRVPRGSGEHEVRCFVRTTSPIERLKGFEFAYGDAWDASSIERTLWRMEAFGPIAGVEYTPRVLEASLRAGMERLVVSSTSAYWRFSSSSTSRLPNEALLLGSGLGWTVGCPSMIYGTELDHNVHKPLRSLARSPAFLFRSGENLWQLVYYEDLAKGLYATLTRPRTEGQVYSLPGKRALRYMGLHGGGRVGQKGTHSPHPNRAGAPGALRGREDWGSARRAGPELRENKASPYEKARAELGYDPLPFEEGIALGAERLREAGLVG